VSTRSDPFKQAVKLLLSCSDLEQANEMGLPKYPEQSGRSGRAKDPILLLPPHPSLETWYSFVAKSMQEVPFKKGAPYTSRALKSTQNLYCTGLEGEYLNVPRTAPDMFKDLSTFNSQDQINRELTKPLTLPSASMKAVDRNVKVALCAASYAGHFLDTAQSLLSAVREKVDTLAEPDRKELQGLVQPIATFLERATYASFDSVGAMVGVDVNLTLPMRDRYTSKLHSYLTQHAPTLRNASCSSKEVLPGVAEVALLARNDASHELARLAAQQVATNKARIPNPPKGGGYKGAQAPKKSANFKPPFPASAPPRAAQGVAPFQQSKRGKGRGKGRGRGRGRGKPDTV
jgi:hypothetical protein